MGHAIYLRGVSLPLLYLLSPCGVKFQCHSHWHGANEYLAIGSDGDCRVVSLYALTKAGSDSVE